MKKLLLLSSLLLLGCGQKEEYVTVVNKTIHSVVMITVNGKSSMDDSSATGVFITDYGHIITCAHVLRRPYKTVLIETYYGTLYAAEVLNVDEKRDLALLKINDRSFRAKIADPRSIEVGQKVVAIGNPYGYDWSATVGVVSAKHRDSFMYNLLQTDAAVNPGNSGGPLLNLKGEIVGINNALFSPHMPPGNIGLAFAVSSGQLYEFVMKYRGINQAIKKFPPRYKRSNT